MNRLKKTLALVATLTLMTACFASCDSEETSSSKKDESSKDDTSNSESKDDGGSDDNAEVKLPTDGKEFTVMSWNDELPNMVASYYCADNGWTEDGDTVSKDGVKLNKVAHGVGGGAAAASYDPYFDAGNDIDIFAVEADVALYYVDKTDKSAPLSDVGISDSEFDGQYGYTKAVAKDANGVTKGASWQAAPGGFAYRADLAETHLGAKNPDEMQALVSDWTKFEETAKKLSDATGGETALTASLGGVWQVFSSCREEAWVVDNKLNVDSSVTDFLNLAKSLQENDYSAGLMQWAEDGSWLSAGQTDKVMGYFISTWGVGQTILGSAMGNKYDDASQVTEQGTTYGKWNLCIGPSEFFWGGSWIFVSPTTDNADLCADVIRYFTVEEASMKNFAEKTGDFVNNKNVMKEIVAAGTNKNATLKDEQDQFALFYDVAAKIDLDGKLTAYDADIKTAFGPVYQDYADGKYATTDEAITAFKEEVAAKVTGITVE